MDDEDEQPGNRYLVRPVRVIGHDDEPFIGIDGLLSFLGVVAMAHQAKAEMAQVIETQDPEEVYISVLNKGAGIVLGQMQELLLEAKRTFEESKE